MFGRKRKQAKPAQEGNWSAETVTIIKNKLLEDPPYRDMQIGLIEDEGREVLRLDIRGEHCGDQMVFVAPTQEFHVSVIVESIISFPKGMDRLRVLEKINECNRQVVHMTFVLVDDIKGMPPFLRMKSSFMCDAPNRTADQTIFFISMVDDYLAEVRAEFKGLA